MTLEIEGRIFEAIRGPDVGMYLSATWTHYVSYTPETETREAIIRMSDEQWINMAASMGIYPHSMVSILMGIVRLHSVGMMKEPLAGSTSVH
jgi:hypothetical protein